MFERFTERARNVVVLAQDEARHLNHNYIGTEHLLLGLLRETEGLAAKVLDSLGVELAAVRDHVRRIVGQGDEVRNGQMPFTPRGKETLEQSLKEAVALGHNYIGTEHILLGLADVKKGVAARILLDLGIDADTIRAEVMRMLSRPSSSHPLTPLPPGEPFEPQSPPLAPDVVAELARLSHDKEEALQRQDFERAARLRDRERRLIDACLVLMRVWNERNDLA